MSNEANQEYMFNVEVEGKCSAVFDTVDAAVSYSVHHVYLPSMDVERGKELLRAGCVFSYCYGFSGVNIVPVAKRRMQASRKALEAEITQLRALIQKAQSESELIDYKGKAAIVVPYSFMRAATEMPEQAQAVEPVGYWLERAKELVEIFVEKPRDASPPAQQVAVPAGIPHSGADEMPPIFGRRWRLARDGFGLQRDDESGNYVHIDDAISTMHTMLAAAPQLPQGDTL